MTDDRKKLAFVFVSPDVDPVKHRMTIALTDLDLIVAGTKNHTHAVEVCRDLVKEGVSVIELCAGFGNVAAGKISEAVPGIPVGVVKFDRHPFLGGKSGDEVFG